MPYTQNTTSLVVRPIESNEIDALSSLAIKTFTDTFGHLYKSEDLNMFLEGNHTPHCYRALFADPDYEIWVGCDDLGALHGYVVAGACNLPAPDMPSSAGELLRLYVDKGMQNSGLGGRLLATALDWLEERFDHLYLSVYSENFGAQRLYARHGFQKVHEYTYMVGNHADPEWIMKR